MTTVLLRLVVLWASGVITGASSIIALRRSLRRKAALERLEILG